MSASFHSPTLNFESQAAMRTVISENYKEGGDDVDENENTQQPYSGTQIDMNGQASNIN